MTVLGEMSGAAGAQWYPGPAAHPICTSTGLLAGPISRPPGLRGLDAADQGIQDLRKIAEATEAKVVRGIGRPDLSIAIAVGAAQRALGRALGRGTTDSQARDRLRSGYRARQPVNTAAKTDRHMRNKHQ